MKNNLLQIIKNFAQAVSQSKEKPSALDQVQRQSINPQVQMLNTLRENVLAQTAYTPQAKAYLRTVPLSVLATDTKFFGQNNAPGGMYNGGQGISINPEFLTPGNQNAGYILRHELGHALDANINAEADMSYYPQGKYSADSFEFMKSLLKNPRLAAPIQQFLAPYYQAAGQQEWNAPFDYRHMGDTEGFAEFGTQGQNALLTPVGSYYKNVYAPMSLAPLNYSPVFPVGDNFYR